MNLIDDVPEEWFDIDAGEGVVKRYRHPGCCEGKDKAMTIIKTKLGWLVTCFRCNRRGFKPAINLPPGQMLKWQQAQELPVEAVPEVKLPGDYVKSIPAEGMAWLYLCGITDADIEKYQIGYSPHRNRVILPIYEGDTLVYWQGRYLGEPSADRPKYVNQHHLGRRDTWFTVLEKHTDHVVVVEDILSCIVVGKVSDCYALLNATVPDRLIFKLAREYKQIYLWLDRDKHSKMTGWCLRYRSFGFPVRVIKTDRDPKYYYKEEIMQCVKKGEQQ